MKLENEAGICINIKNFRISYLIKLTVSMIHDSGACLFIMQGDPENLLLKQTLFLLFSTEFSVNHPIYVCYRFSYKNHLSMTILREKNYCMVYDNTIRYP